LHPVGVPYLPIRPCTDNEWHELPHVVLTSVIDRDSLTVDCNGSNVVGSIGWCPPFGKLVDHTPDNSIIYQFKSYEYTYHKRVDSRGGNDNVPSDESSGRFDDFTESIGHTITYKVKVLSRIRLISMDPDQQLHFSADDDKERKEDNSGTDAVTNCDDGNEVFIPDDGKEITKVFDPGGNIGHQGMLLLLDKNYKGSQLNIHVEWENGRLPTSH